MKREVREVISERFRARLSRARVELLARLIVGVARALLWTLRYHQRGDVIDGAGVIAFLHGEQLPLLLHRPRDLPTVAPISLSADGDLQAIVMRSFGVDAVRGSTSRGALRAWRGLYQRLRHRGAVALIAVDGPRGPYGSVSPGAAHLARALDLPYWVCKVECSSALRLSSWDRFMIPLPFSRVDVVTTRCEPSVELTGALLLTPDQLYSDQADPEPDS